MDTIEEFSGAHAVPSHRVANPEGDYLGLDEGLQHLIQTLPAHKKEECEKGIFSLDTLNLLYRLQKEKSTKESLPRRSGLPPVVGSAEVRFDDYSEHDRPLDDLADPRGRAYLETTVKVTPSYTAPIHSVSTNADNLNLSPPVHPPPDFQSSRSRQSGGTFLRNASNNSINEHNVSASGSQVSVISAKYVPEIGPFDEAGFESLQEYINRFEHFCSSKYGPDRRLWVGILESKLKGDYLTHYKMNGGINANYDVIKCQLINYYNLNKELGNIQINNFSSAKYQGEGVYNYMSKLRFLFKREYPEDDPETSDILYKKVKETIPDAVRKLVVGKYLEMRTLFNIKMSYRSLQDFVLSIETLNEPLESEKQTYTYVEDTTSSQVQKAPLSQKEKIIAQ